MLEVERIVDTPSQTKTGAFRCVLCKGAFDELLCPEDHIPTIPSFEWNEEDKLQGRILNGQYITLFEIGSGAAARVFSAWDRVNEEHVALKLIRDAADKEQIERFRREAIATKKFQHPNIVGLISAGHDIETGTVFLVLEHLEGRPLDKLIASEAPVNPTDALGLAIPICEALNAIHQGGLIHRDLKPANLFVARNGDGIETVKILDFGITRFMGDDPVDHNLTAGRVLGSVVYASPEQALRQPLDARSDLYGLGVILYELLIGLPPFDRGEPLETLKAHVEEQTPVLPLEFTRDVADLVESLLEKDPNRRPQNAVQVLAAMDRILSRLKRSEIVQAAEGEESQKVESPVASATWHGRRVTHSGVQLVEEPKGKGKKWVVGLLVGLGTLVGLAVCLAWFLEWF